jgi:hypothetical protein
VKTVSLHANLLARSPGKVTGFEQVKIMKELGLKTNNILQQHHGNTLYTKLQLLLPVGSDQFEYINNMKSDYEATIFFSLCLIYIFFFLLKFCCGG